jgi:hypothetical protein
MAWKDIFQDLEGPPMDDFHEFCHHFTQEIKA